VAIPRTTILPVVTVPTGGWLLDVKVGRTTSLDTTVTATIAAGDYFVSWDNQSDDFLLVFANAVNAAIDAAHADFPTDSLQCYLDSNHKVKIVFEDSYYKTTDDRDVQIRWTQRDGDDIAKVLGFDYSADDTSTGVDNPVFTADWQHGYGWYANEDGLTNDLAVEDVSEVYALQSRAHSGVVRTQRIAQRFSNELSLQFLPRNRTFSQNVGYGETSVQPYEINQGLECWWLQAQQGKRFRVYRDGRYDTTTAALRGVATGSTTTTLTDSGRSFDIDPQIYKGRILWIAQWGTNVTSLPGRFYIASHTATAFTVSNAGAYSQNMAAGGTTYYVFDQPYQTYVLDLEKMDRFGPREIPALDRYNIKLPLLRYVSP
jgi:hypothetical protein